MYDMLLEIILSFAMFLVFVAVAGLYIIRYTERGASLPPRAMHIESTLRQQLGLCEHNLRNALQVADVNRALADKYKEEVKQLQAELRMRDHD